MTACVSDCALCILLCVCIAVCAIADPVYTLEHIGRKEGLPQMSVRSIAVDKLGFLWVGTETGVARYDGYRFMEITPPFNNGVVMAIHVDSRNRLWVRWYGKPLTLYDPALDHWQSVQGGDAVGILGGFAEDPGGQIWMSTNFELLRYDERLQRLIVAAALTPEPISRYAPQYAQQIVLHRDAVWVAAHHEVVRYDAKRAALVQRIPVAASSNIRLWLHRDALWLCNADGVFRLHEATAQWEAFYVAAHAPVSACEFASDGALWIGTENAGAIRVFAGAEQRFRHREQDPTGLADDFVIGLQSDSRGQMWVITPGVAHRWLGHRFERFAFSPDSQRANPGGLAADLFVEDPSGVLWLGSEDWGLAKISPFALKARHLLPPSTVNSHVRTPVVDRDGNVWMGMNQDGVFRWTRRTGAWTHFAAAADDPLRLPTREVRAMLAARDGSIWAGSQSGGIISKYLAASDSWQRVAIGKDNPIFNFLEYPNGHFIIGRDSWVTDFDPATRQSRHYPTPGKSPVRAAVLSRSGSVFFGTHQGGVMEFVPGRGFGRAWIRELSDLNVFSVYEDRYGHLWVGTWGGGLDRLDTRSGKVQVIAETDGLPDGTIFGILPGPRDELWVSTYSGLAKVENCIVADWPCRPAVAVLDSSNGLPFSEFDAEAAALSPTGELYFGGLDGLLWLDPRQIELNRRPPRLQLAAMYLNGRALAPFWLAQAGARPHLLELEHNFGSLKIDFSALDFHASVNNRYRYRLSSASGWLPLGGNPEIVLNNLDAGRHVLEIMGANNDGIWSEQPLTLPIRVLAPWYRSTFAWLAYAALAALAVAASVQWRERRLRANTARLEATVAERTRELAAANTARDEFYANVSHEIRTPLTLLVGTAAALKSNPSEGQLSKLCADLLRHSDSLRRYVESLITVSHLQSSPAISWLQEDVTAYLRGLIADFERIAADTAITLDATGERCLVRSYPNALDTIFCNLLSNAIRHTPSGGWIKATVTEEADGVSIAILDSGAGIDPQLLASLFERGPRGASVVRTTIGYGIGLNLVRQTVLALGGTIGARNADVGGACFTVTLPRADPSLPVASYERTPLCVAIDRSPTQPDPGSHPPASGKARGSILVIEDHAELRIHIAALFAANYRVREAASVASGLASARAYLPDVVICDVMLPDGQGFDVVAALKSDPITDHISVILLTALADEASRLRGLTDQADLYVTKPFLREELELQVANLVNQRRRLRRAAARDLWARRAATGDAKPPPKRESFESRLLAALEDAYADPECRIETLAGRLAMSRKQLERKTRYCFQCSPKVLLNRYRLDKALALLRQGVRIADVAQRCGFSNQSHFGALFKKRFGHAPSKEKTPSFHSEPLPRLR